MITNRDYLNKQISKLSNHELAVSYCAAVANLRGSECLDECSCDECQSLNEEWLKKRCTIITHDQCTYCKKIEDLSHMKYCSKLNRTVNGTAFVMNCSNFIFKEKKND